MLANPFAFSGRIGRAQYIVTLVVSMLILIASVFVIGIYSGISPFSELTDSSRGRLFTRESARLFSISAFISTWFSAALFIRRMRDAFDPDVMWMKVIRVGFWITMPLFAFLQIFSPLYEQQFYNGLLNANLFAALLIAAFLKSNDEKSGATPAGSATDIKSSAAYRTINSGRGPSADRKGDRPTGHADGGRMTLSARAAMRGGSTFGKR